MKNNVLYSKGNNDECYTPDYGVEAILEFIPFGAVVWCPFDKKESEFVKQISKTAPATPFGQLVGNPSNRYK